MPLHERLCAEFAQRRQRNARYSLRAFARDLDADHATLSQILRKRRPISARFATKLGLRLKLDRTTLVEAGLEQNVQGILRLFRSGKARPDSRWIAIRTGIPVDGVNAALHLLLRKGRLAMTSTKQWKIKR